MIIDTKWLYQTCNFIQPIKIIASDFDSNIFLLIIYHPKNILFIKKNDPLVNIAIDVVSVLHKDAMADCLIAQAASIKRCHLFVTCDVSNYLK